MVVVGVGVVVGMVVVVVGLAVVIVVVAFGPGFASRPCCFFRSW